MSNVKFAIIAAVDGRGALGYNNKLIVNSPSDMNHFKETTKGNIVIMGRTTYQSLHEPLKDRVNIVISTKLKYNIPDDVFVASSIKEALKIASIISKKQNKEIFIIGGESIYDALLPIANDVILTRFKTVADNADCFFDNANELSNFETYMYKSLGDDGQVNYYRRVLQSSRTDSREL